MGLTMGFCEVSARIQARNALPGVGSPGQSVITFSESGMGSEDGGQKTEIGGRRSEVGGGRAGAKVAGRYHNLMCRKMFSMISD